MSRAVWIVCFFASVASAQTPAPAEASRVDARLEALERVIAPLDPIFTYARLGPVASKIYDGTTLGPRFGLSSELFTFSGGTPVTESDQAGRHSNVLMVAPTLGYRPHRRLIFNAQFNFATGGAESSNTVTLRRGSSVVRLAYLDWLWGERTRAGLRLGHQLIPIGSTNTSADPTTYFGVRRPEVERVLIPADWHENGVLAYYDERFVTAELGAFTSLNSKSLRGPTFLSEGRSQGQNGPSDDVMGVARLNWNPGPWLFAASLVYGDSAQGNVAIPGGNFTLGEAHARWHWARFELEGQVAQGKLKDAGVISSLNGTVMGEDATGASGHAAVELLGTGEAKLWTFVRAARVNLHQRVPAGFVANPRLDARTVQVGLHYLPIPLVVLKSDFVLRRFGDDSSDREVWASAGFTY